MTITGAMLGFMGASLLLIVGLLFTISGLREKSRGNAEAAKLLSRISRILLITAGTTALVTVILSGLYQHVEPRTSNDMTANMASSPPIMGSGTIGHVDEKEVESLKNRITKNPKDVVALERLGHLYLQMQNYDGVFQTAHDALKINPKSAESRAHMGMVLFAMQQNDQAIQQLNRALAINPKLGEAALFKSIVELQGMNDPQAAQKTADNFLKQSDPRDPFTARVQAFLAMLKSRLGSPSPDQ